MRRLYPVLALLVLLMLSACGDSAIFLAPVEEAADVRVDTIEPGSILSPGSEVPVFVVRDPVFTGDPTTADRLVVELLDADGILLGEQTYESVDQADDLPALVLPEIGEGLFILRTSYYDGEDLIHSDDVPFFISTGEFAILGLSSFPATLYPGSGGLLSLNYVAPLGMDPYVEWYFDDELVRGAFMSETGTELEIDAPEEPGAYTVRADLYPAAPDYTDGVAPAVVSYTTELLVATETVLVQSDLSPERSYYALYHFLGNARDTGARTAMFGTTGVGGRFVGDPALAVAPDIFGYRLDGDDGFALDGFILPVRDHRLSPFSLSFRIRPDELSDGARVLSVETGDAELLTLGVTGDGAVALGLENGTVEVVSDPGALEAGRTSLLTVTILPVDDTTVVQFYVDGETLMSELVSWDVGQVVLPDPVETAPSGWMDLPGSAVVGGDGGFIGILDEFGVYFRDDGDEPSPDTGIFLSAMEQMYGDKLIYAEGFEGPELPEAIEVTGAAAVESGSMILGDGGAALFPVFAFSSEELFVTISFDALPGSRVRFFVGDESEPVLDILAADARTETTDLEFEFVHSDSLLLIDGPAVESTEIRLEPGTPFTGLRLEVSQVGTDPARIAVQSVVVWREHPEIPESLLTPVDAPAADEPQPDPQTSSPGNG